MNKNKFKVQISNFIISIILIGFCFIASAEAEMFIADYSVAKESVLRSIPVKHINAAKQKLHIMYCGTSHSSQVVDGMSGLMEYKKGDDTLFAVTFDGKSRAGFLDIHYRPSEIYPAIAKDLSRDKVDDKGKTGYFYATIKYLDNHPKCNVIMWSWCSIERHDVQIYLDNFETLIKMYKAGGLKRRTEENEVKFVFMTGYARGGQGDNPNALNSPYVNAEKIKQYCRKNKHYCLDYWSQDVYDYGTDSYNPFEKGNENRQHRVFTDKHRLGQDWFKCRSFKNGEVKWPAHCSKEPYAQHLTGNRRAYAAWYIWAKLAGWD